MPIHGLRTDIELVGLVGSAALFSYLVTDQIVSNFLLTALVAGLFFLTGLHIDFRGLRRLGSKHRQVLTGLTAVYIAGPLAAVVLGYFFAGLRETLLIIGISAAALGSPKIWSNMTNSDGELASNIGALSFMSSIIAVPVLVMALGIDLNYSLVLKNGIFPVSALAVGIGLRHLDTAAVEDLNIHFSKLCFWLILLITGIQTHMLFVSQGYGILNTFATAAMVFMVFTFLCGAMGYLIARSFVPYEKEARGIGFVSGSKNVAIAFFLALHINGLVVALIGVYYLVRQVSGTVAVDLILHGELKTLKRLVLKASQPLS